MPNHHRTSTPFDPLSLVASALRENATPRRPTSRKKKLGMRKVTSAAVANTILTNQTPNLEDRRRSMHTMSMNTSTTPHTNKSPYHMNLNMNTLTPHPANNIDMVDCKSPCHTNASTPHATINTDYKSPYAAPPPSSSPKSKVTFNHTPSSSRSQQHHHRSLSSSSFRRFPFFLSPPPTAISRPNTHDQNLIHELDHEYKQSILEYEIAARARQESVRNIMIFTVVLFALYLMLGCLYYSKWDGESQWTIEESLIFLIYTVTTVGYGNHDIPTSPTSRICTMAFILIGIALVTVFFSEIFQYIVIKAAKAQYIYDEEKITLLGINKLSMNDEVSDDDDDDDDDHDLEEGENDRCIGDLRQRYAKTSSMTSLGSHINGSIQRSPLGNVGHILRSFVFGTYSNVKILLQTTKIGRYLMILLPFVFLLLLGSVVVGYIEGWNSIDSLYWAVVTLTTVGYGDLAPSKPGSIWFCIFYLPTSTIFLSLFLSHVASAYIQLHIAHVIRIEKRLTRSTLNNNDNDSSNKKNDIDSMMLLTENPSGETEGSEDSAPDQQVQPMNNDIPEDDNYNRRPSVNARSFSMRDLQRRPSVNSRSLSLRDLQRRPSLNPRSLSMRDLIQRIPQDSGSTPPLPLRTEVQERVAYIISVEFKEEKDLPKLEMKGNEVSFTFLKWKEVAEKWMIPKKAKLAFKTVCCEVVLSLGTNTLSQYGMSVLLELDSKEFQRLFNPFSVALVSVECMEAWMLSTEDLVQDKEDR